MAFIIPELQIETSSHNLAQHRFTEAIYATEKPIVIEDSWETRGIDLEAIKARAEVLAAHEDKGNVFQVYGRWNGLHVYLTHYKRGKQVSVYIVGALDQAEAARALMAEIRRIIPLLRATRPDEVPISFWSQTQHGCRRNSKLLSAPEWKEVRGNYVSGVQVAVDGLVQVPDKTMTAGRLMLWHGEPGTGKTHAIRALAREWSGWCQTHFITDPDAMLASGDYVMQVLDKDINHDEDDERDITHHLLIMEDTGELLVRDAKERTGQGLSRLLNIVDGMLGQGSNAIVLITTNEDLGTMHEAVIRPGRCSMNLEFDRFSADAATAWLAEHGTHEATGSGLTLADMYAMLRGHKVKTAKRTGFGR